MNVRAKSLQEMASFHTCSHPNNFTLSILCEEIGELVCVIRINAPKEFMHQSGHLPVPVQAVQKSAIRCKASNVQHITVKTTHTS